MTLLKNTILSILMIPLFIFLTGCVPLVIGAAAGAGGVAWVQGRLAKNLDSSVEEVYHASIGGLKDIKYPIIEDDLNQEGAHIKATDDRGDKVDIRIHALTENAAQIQIRVGFFGNEKKSQIILEAIENRL
ncbi:MAG: DUF3568 family protein [Planctomycetes bacterium]|nr:DUF3568 family protein [Planctomycetota bacterium]